MTSAATMRGYAEALAGRFHVFPVDHPQAGKRCRGIKDKAHNPDACNKRGKHPTCKWSEWSTQELDLLAKQWYFGGREPRNIGIDCGKSDLLVVDEDEHGEFDRFCETHGVTVPPTFTVRTAKGRHFYFKQPQARSSATKRACSATTRSTSVASAGMWSAPDHATRPASPTPRPWPPHLSHAPTG